MNEFAYEYNERHVFKEKEQTGAEIISAWLKDKIFLGMSFKELHREIQTHMPPHKEHN